ncbi:hypothetical protein LXT21_29010 [Myxococcus sp. K38C18041901]|uniref:hypothetical protein n=1 Tax=Myxococcus guangdongensis TaxID=2906760 RepID=UPI0020A763B9|nr:hypothetical protein [Myxococcus guangdongensis]MCP3062832.1 hypothetical protein [Myxococcus guangdongensis]
MLSKVFMSAVVMMASLTGVVAASGADTADFEAGEQVCIAMSTEQERVPPGPTAACPSSCLGNQRACMFECQSNAACRSRCVQEFIACCGGA